MNWWLRGWNERSFIGWKALWAQLALVAALFLVVRQLFFAAGAAPLLIDWVRITLSLAVAVLLLARFTRWQTGLAFLAAVAGWSRVIWGALLIPLIDALAVRVWPGFINGAYWVAPTEVAGWLVSGWNGDGFASLGVLSALIGSAWLMYVRARAASVGGVKTLASALVVVAGWAILLVPSLIAWTKLSTYGATFASGAVVVEQAFARVFDRSGWVTGYERFLGLSDLQGLLSVPLMTTVLLWILLFSLLAPARALARAARVWRERGERLIPMLGILFGGMLFAAVRVVGQTILARGMYWVAAVGIALLFARLIEAPEDEEEESFFVNELLLAGVGAMLFGWSAFFFGVVALGLARTRLRSVSLLERALLTGGIGGVVFSLGGSLLRVAPSWSPAHLAGIGLLVAVLDVAFIWKRDGLSLNEPPVRTVSWPVTLLIAFIAAMLVLWWGVGAGLFGVIVVAFTMLFAAILWLFSFTERQELWIKGALLLLLGMLLHPGLFLP